MFAHQNLRNVRSSTDVGFDHSYLSGGVLALSVGLFIFMPACRGGRLCPTFCSFRFFTL